MDSEAKSEIVSNATYTIFLIIYFVFGILATLVLLYYIRRRYYLNLEIRGITEEQLWDQNYKNHLKNLKVKAMITNFIIVILLIEITNNFGMLIQNIQYWFGVFKWYFTENTFVLDLIDSIVYFSIQCYIVTLCLFLKVLVPYKYTIMRWVAYMLLRSLFLILCVDGWVFISQTLYPPSGQSNTTNALETHIGYDIREHLHFICDIVFNTTDLTIYIVYSRRFYQHLKGRELEAKLFMDRNRYVERMSVRIHFKVATILVTIAFFFIALGQVSLHIKGAICDFSIFHNYQSSNYPLVETFIKLPRSICAMIFRFMLNMDYLYVICVILIKYCRQKRQLTRVNDRIRPIVDKYHENIFSRFYYY